MLGLFSHSTRQKSSPGQKLSPGQKSSQHVQNGVQYKHFDSELERNIKINIEAKEKQREAEQKQIEAEQKQREVKQKQREVKQKLAMQDGKIKVLTWNICWGCMASDETSKDDTTAATIAKVCADEKMNHDRDTCFSNVSNLIGRHSDADIIGLQEATRIKDLLKSKVLKEMKAVVFGIKKGKSLVQIATFYNQNKFELLGAMCGNLDPTGSDVRLYQIILLTYISKNDEKVLLIVVNLHNGKQYNTSSKIKTEGFSKKEIEEKLNECLSSQMGYLPVNGNIFASSEDTPIQISTDSSFDDHQLIAVGDFNDNADKYNEPYFKEYPGRKKTEQPFKKDKFYEGFTLLGKKLHGKSPGNTCCVGNKSLPEKDSKGNIIGYEFEGDYVVSTLGFLIPPTKDNTQETKSSDHGCVIAVLGLIPAPVPIGAEEIDKAPDKKTKSSNFFSLSSIPFLGKLLSRGGGINESEEEYYKRKYLIYKKKYLELKHKK